MKFLLPLHNIIRWVVLLLGLFSLYRAYRGWPTNSKWSNTDRKAGLFFVISIDVQVIIGVFLYFLFSPIVKTLFQDFRNGMANSSLRFFGIEHIFLMLLGVVLAHIGNSTSKKEIEVSDKFRRIAILFSLSILAILIGIPWFRPLLPGLY